MKLRNIIIIVLFLLVAASSAAFIFSEQSHNLEITLKTNGTDVQIQTSSIPFFTSIPGSMKHEMEQKAINDIYEDSSTVDSIKGDMKDIAHNYNYNITVKIVSQYGTDQLPMPATVKGTSMQPTLHEGQELIVLKTKDLKVGEIVVARHPSYGLIVKRLTQIKGDEVYLMSDNREVIVKDNMITKGLDTWLPTDDVVGVVEEIN